ncbi:hypothetical protein [Variovorax sp. PBL-E5]|uniref:hypothetical protein n=1 Tax=Variovorax sp. PBL-E5 TaxID=434014 RepID=UPI001316F8E0|nr:hypothetical protein [Variovorax sp. PBL-E5]VTU37081.1 hypothetical protein E5CHR_04479 [Variovorax sp. PBL-E5]
MLTEIIPAERRPSAHKKGLVEMAASIIAAAELRAAEPPPVIAPPPKAVRRARGTAPIDFHVVPWHQRDIDDRLRNWAAWCNGSSAPSSAPMFRMAPPPTRARAAYGSLTVPPVDRADAVKIASAVTALPGRNSAAIHWAYCKPVSPNKACRAIGTSMEGLAQLLHDGRQMLINRGY